MVILEFILTKDTILYTFLKLIIKLLKGNWYCSIRDKIQTNIVSYPPLNPKPDPSNKPLLNRLKAPNNYTVEIKNRF